MPAFKPITIDCNYLRPRFAASYLIHDGGEAAFIDNNTAHSVPLLLKALGDAGLKPEQVRCVIITHVHLDHSGGSSLLMKACPNAKLLAHPRAAQHVIDPSRLVKGAQVVYGLEQFASLYGSVEPVVASRVQVVSDLEEVKLGARLLKFIFTRGHANHHMCILSDGAIFTGDSFGLVYPDLQSGGLFTFFSTSPTDFDAVEARKSVDLIVESGAKTAYPTHFGKLEDLQAARLQLLEWIDFSDALLIEAQLSRLADEDLSAFCEKRIWIKIEEVLRARGVGLQDRLLGSGSVNETVSDLLRLDIELNAQGLAHVAVKRRHPKETARI